MSASQKTVKTRPARDLIVDSGLLLAATRRHGLCFRDMGVISQGVLDYASETLWPAISALAFLVRDYGKISSGTGLTFERDTLSPEGQCNFIMRKSGETEAIHIAVRHYPELSDIGRVRQDELNQKIAAERADLDEDTRTKLLVQDLVEPSQEYLDFYREPENWARPTPASPVTRIFATRFCMAKATQNCGKLEEFLPLRKDPELSWPGRALDLTPSAGHQKFGEDLKFSSTSVTDYAPTEIFLLRDLCEGIVELDLADVAAERNETIGAERWKQYGQIRHATLLEIGMSMVYRAGGLVTNEVVDELAHCRAQISAGDLAQARGALERAIDICLAGDGEEFGLALSDRWAATACTSETFNALFLADENGEHAFRVDAEEVSILDGHDLEAAPLARFVITPDGLTPADVSAADLCLERTKRVNNALVALDSIATFFRREDSRKPERSKTPSEE